MRALLVHTVMQTGKINYHPIMPMGFFSIADLLNRNGIPCEIVNLGVEYDLDPRFDVAGYVVSNGVSLVGADLHWYLHSHSAIELCRRIKKETRARTVLGGYTASCFAEEIIRNHREVDAVVRGEGEIPFLLLAEKMPASDPDLSTVPGVTSRAPDGAPRSAPPRRCSREELDSFDFAAVEHLKNWRHYTRISPGSPVIQYTNTPRPIDHVFYVFTGRGCSQSCPYCGGSNASYRTAAGGAGPIFRDPERVVAEMKKLRSLGVRFFYFEFDPYPAGDPYYVRLFNRIREERLDVGVNFGAWSLPSRELADAFAAAADPDHSCIVISPDSGSEEIRRLNKAGFGASNDEILSTLDYLRGKKIHTAVCFTLGIPGETRKHFRQTLDLIKSVRKRSAAAAGCFKLEPCAPIFLDPARYGVQLYRTTFADFHDHALALTRSLPIPHPLGYRTAHFSENEILRLQMKAYRACYFRLRYFLSRLKKMKGVNRMNFYAFLAVLFNSPRLLQNVQRE
ncbi:MAG: radical SAM protein [bacterium]